MSIVQILWAWLLAWSVMLKGFFLHSRNLKTIDQELRTLNKRLATVEKTLGQNAESTEEEFRSKLHAYNATKKYIAHLKKNASVSSLSLYL